MDDTTKAKLFAASKIALGAARMASGLVTATGHGMLGAVCRSQHNMTAALRIGKMSVEGGKRQLDQGIAEWKRADS